MFTDWTGDGGVTWRGNAEILPWLLNALSQDYAENVSGKSQCKPEQTEAQEISILFLQGSSSSSSRRRILNCCWFKILSAQHHHIL
jgi:hypothetical protein